MFYGIYIANGQHDYITLSLPDKPPQPTPPFPHT